MEKSIIINKKVFKVVPINATYYISSNGEVYSAYSKKIVKTLYRGRAEKRYAYIDIYLNGRQRHIPIHKIVYMSWAGKIPQGMQVNHKDDNQLNNNVNNLYIGSQKENIRDCISNGHRVGSINYLTVFDKERNKVMTFCPASDFIEYSGHPSRNGCVNRMFSRNWFKKRFSLLDYNLVSDLDELKRVTTIADECKQVE